MAVTIENLQIEIEGNSKSASDSLDKLIKTLDRLKTAVGVDSDYSGLGKLAQSMQPLSNLKVNVSGLNKLPQVLTALNSAPDISAKIKGLVDAGNTLKTLEKNNLNSFLNSLKKIPEISASLDKMDMNKFATQMKIAADAIRPLANEMEKVSNGFKAFPIRIQKIIENGDKLTQTNKKMSNSFSLMNNGITWVLAKLNLYYISVKRAARIVSDWITESNAYQENLNLFTVTMGDAAEAAGDYAKAVEKAMGIDSSEWMRYQGIFQQILSGFGVLEEKATTMSRNLTQLIYDSASFFNTSIETASQKFQSGIAGELEPLRRWGYALDQATLKQTALNHGINVNFNEMTQAQKALLRYVAIMEQSKNVIFDLGRSLDTPNNQLRILNQRITMLKRALGNAFIPIIIEIIPYVQALAQVIADAANALATFMGFKITKIDYSKSVKSVGSLGEAYEGLNEEVTKYKRSMAGIDEINILGKPSEKGVGEGLDNFDLDIALPDVSDWLGQVEGRGQEVYKEVKRIVDQLKPLAVTLASLFAVKKYMDLKKWLIDVTKDGFKPLVAFQEAHYAALARGAGGMKSFSAGMTALRKSISPLVKVLIGAGGAIIAFVTFSDVIYGLSKGTKELKDGLAQLIATTALVGTVMYAVLGPVGLVITAVGALTGALTGHAKAVKEKAIDELYDDIGLSSGELALLTQGLGDKIFEMAEPMDEYKVKIMDLENQFESYTKSFSENVEKVGESSKENEEIVKNVISDLKGMVETVDEKLKTTTSTALTEYKKLALENDGFISEEESNILKSIEENYGTQKNRLQTIQDEITKIYSEAMGKRGKLTDEELRKIHELTKQMTDLASFQSKIESNRAQILIDDIASGRRKVSSDNIKDIKADVEAQYKTAYDKLTEWKATQYSLYETTLSGRELAQAKASVDDQYNTQLEGLSTNILKIFDAIESQLKGQIPDGYGKLNYDNPLASFLAGVGNKIIGVIDSDSAKNNEKAAEIERQLKLLEKEKNSYVPDMPTLGSGGFRSGYATGGFPERGSLFVADEYENEMKGFMDNRPVVAKNQQIVDGIARGVKQAMTESGGNQGGDWYIQIVDDSGNVKGETVITAAQRKNRRDGKTVIPLGV